jgi:Tol biopolymer transport system component
VQGTNWILFSAAFGRDYNGGNASHIYAVRADGTGLRRITNGSTFDVGAVLSPDGTKVAYRASPGDGIHGQGGIYVTNLDAAQPKLLVPGFVSSPPVWSPDGSSLAFSMTGPSKGEINLAVVDIRSGKLQWVTHDSSQWDGMVWTAGGSSLVAVKDARYAAKPGGVSIERVPVSDAGQDQTLWKAPATLSAGGEGSFPPLASGALSPAGSKIVYSASVASASTSLFKILDLSLGTTTQVAIPSGGYWPSGWSPDGSSLVLAGPGEDSKHEGIWTISTDGSNLHRVIGDIPPQMNGSGTLPRWGFAPKVQVEPSRSAPTSSPTPTFAVSSGSVKGFNWTLTYDGNHLGLMTPNGQLLATVPISPNPQLSFQRYEVPGTNATIFFGSAAPDVSSVWLFISGLPSKTYGFSQIPGSPGAHAWYQVDIPGTGPGQVIALDNSCQPLQAIDITTGSTAATAKYTYCKPASA